MTITQEQAERVDTLIMVKTVQQAAQNMFREPEKKLGMCLTNQKIISVIQAEAAAQNISPRQYVEYILWDLFFPHEPRNQKPATMMKVCPVCGSKHILEPNRGFNLNWECFACHAEFEAPVWVPREKPKLELHTIQTCPFCDSSEIGSPNRRHPGVYFCYRCRGTFEQPAERTTHKKSKVSNHD